MYEVGLEFEVWSSNSIYSVVVKYSKVTVMVKCMKLALSLKYGVWYSIYSVVVKYSKVTVIVGQNRYSKLRIPSQHTRYGWAKSIFQVANAKPISHTQYKHLLLPVNTKRCSCDD